MQWSVSKYLNFRWYVGSCVLKAKLLMSLGVKNAEYYCTYININVYLDGDFATLTYSNYNDDDKDTNDSQDTA